MSSLKGQLEEILVRCIREGNQAFGSVPESLEPGHFLYPEHRTIFTVLKHMYEDGEEVNPKSVAQMLKAIYYEMDPSYFNPSERKDGLRRTLNTLDSLCKLECEVSMTVSELCDLVVQQSSMNQSNVSPDQHSDDQDHGKKGVTKPHTKLSWIQVYRQMLEHGWLVNHKLLALWLYLLLRASFKEHKYRVDVKRNNAMTTEEVLLKKGQLIFGRKKAAEATGLSEQNVRTLMASLKRQGNITIESNRHFSIVTIINWSYYQYLTNNEPPV